MIQIFFLSGAISLVLLFLGLRVRIKLLKSFEKSSPFECGFSPSSGSHSIMNLHFALVAILFAIFDVEVILFLPSLLGGVQGQTVIMYLVLLVLTLFLVYE